MGSTSRILVAQAGQAAQGTGQATAADGSARSGPHEENDQLLISTSQTRAGRVRAGWVFLLVEVVREEVLPGQVTHGREVVQLLQPVQPDRGTPHHAPQPFSDGNQSWQVPRSFVRTSGSGSSAGGWSATSTRPTPCPGPPGPSTPSPPRRSRGSAPSSPAPAARSADTEQATRGMA